MSKLWRVREFPWDQAVKDGFPTEAEAYAWADAHSGGVRDSRYVEPYEGQAAAEKPKLRLVR